MRISVELVPRSEESLARDLAEIRDHLPAVDTVNIPDLYRFALRSWNGCVRALDHVASAIPHLRAIDIDLARPLPFAEVLKDHGIEEVLVVAGDAPVDMSRPVYGSSTVDVIRKIRRELPELRVYAGLDPYRQSFVQELDYVERKLEAGACGFFTQPFFDLRLMEIYAELCSGLEIFWGATNVTSPRSKRYWETRNHAVFPASFLPTAAWNRTFASQMLEFVRSRDQNIYFMPIRSGPREYLEGIL